MIEILSVRTIFRRLFVLLIVLLTFGYNLYFYNTNQEEITYYRPYYAESYLYAAEHKVTMLNVGANAQAEMAKSASVPVLVYHGVVQKEDGVSTSLKTFKNQMFALKKAGYQTVRLEDFYKYIQGEKDLPEKSFLITFDDGRKDSFYPVDPILAELNYTAVMFIITGTLETKSNPFHLVKPEIEKMIETRRWDVQAHTSKGHGLIDIDENGTKGHFYSNKMWLPDKKRMETSDEFTQRIQNDLLKAKLDLKNSFNINSYAFAFPFNDYAQESKNFKEAEKIFMDEAQKRYSLLFYQTDPDKGSSFNLKASKANMIKRVNVEGGWKENDLLAVIKSGEEKKIPVKIDNFSKQNGWIQAWGASGFENNNLVLRSTDEVRGSSVFLNGTSSWKKYDYEISALKNKEDSIYLLFNYQNEKNYSYFRISNSEATFIEKIDNVEKAIASAPLTQNIDDANLTLRVSVDNGHVVGFLNEQKLTEGNFVGKSGGIGVMMWNDKNINSKVEVNYLSVN